MPFFTDQVGRTINLAQTPRRIISLVPSLTELLYHLQLEKAVIGITRFCIHPQHWFHSKTRIGGTKDINIPLVRSLQPDLIIASKEENVRDQLDLLWNDIPTWVSDVKDLPSALCMITEIGVLTGKEKNAASLAEHIQNAFIQLPYTHFLIPAAYLIWRKPYMGAGGDAFIHHMMQAAGFRNVFADKQRYPVIDVAQLRTSGCRVVLLSTEPYPFSEKHVAELATELPETTFLLADGQMFSWYGSRMLLAPPYFISLRKKLTEMLTNLNGKTGQ